MSQTYAIVDDPFVIRETRHGAAEGPLKGLRLAVKDLFDVEGLPTACGVLDWPKANQPATGTASAVAITAASAAGTMLVLESPAKRHSQPHAAHVVERGRPIPRRSRQFVQSRFAVTGNTLRVLFEITSIQLRARFVFTSMSCRTTVALRFEFVSSSVSFPV